MKFKITLRVEEQLDFGREEATKQMNDFVNTILKGFIEENSYTLIQASFETSDD